MPLKIRRFLPILFALTPLLVLPEAHALVFGDIRSASRLGELLHAEVDIEEDAADRFDASCVKLYRPAQADADLPWITEARLRFRRENGKGKLYISSDQPVFEPVVQIGVQSSCAGGRVWRDYTVLLSPLLPAKRDLPVESEMRPKPVPVVSTGRIDRLARSSKKDPGTSGPVLRLTVEDVPLPARTPRTASGLANIDAALPLRMSIKLALASGDSSSEVARDLLRLEYRLLAALHEQVDRQLSLVEKLRQLESSVGESKAVTSPLAAASIATAPAVLPVPEKKPEPPGTTPPAAASPPVVADPSLQRSVPKAGPEAQPTESDGLPIEQLLYIGLGGGLLILLVVVIRRRRVEALAEQFLPMHAPTVIDDSSEFSQPPGPAVAAQVADEVATGELPLAQPTLAQEIPPAPEDLEVTPVMELAEIMLSFGRVNGAAQALQEYIEANPKVALQPWMRLLEIYRDNGMRAEFESLATNLNQNFNVEIVHWGNAAPGERVEMSLELLPHIRDQIDALWGKTECFEYLQKLLRDNRDGQRTGFTLPVVKEILLLIDLMVAEKAATNK